MSTSEGYGEYTLSARRQGEGLLLRVVGQLKLPSAHSLHMALCAICGEEESLEIDVHLDLAGLSFENDESSSEIAAAMGKLLADTRKVSVRAAPQDILDLMRQAGVTEDGERIVFEDTRD